MSCTCCEDEEPSEEMRAWTMIGMMVPGLILRDMHARQFGKREDA